MDPQFFPLASLGFRRGCQVPHLRFGPIRSHQSAWVGPSSPTCSLFPAPRAASSLQYLWAEAGVCVHAAALRHTDTHHAAAAEQSSLVGGLLTRCRRGREVRNAGGAFKGTPLLCLPSLSTTVPPLQLRAQLLSVHLTALHRGNPWDYVSTMLAVRCLLFAAVCARCAVTGRTLIRFFLPCICLLYHMQTII